MIALVTRGAKLEKVEPLAEEMHYYLVLIVRLYRRQRTILGRKVERQIRFV